MRHVKWTDYDKEGSGGLDQKQRNPFLPLAEANWQIFFIFHYTVILKWMKDFIAQSAGAVEYTNCTSAEG